MITVNSFKQQQGAALVIGLVLLVVITVLAISGMNTATTELAMARNDQNSRTRFRRLKPASKWPWAKMASVRWLARH